MLWIWKRTLSRTLAFAAVHPPGYAAIGYSAASVLGRLALNAMSWAIFGAIYPLSGNLWLVVVAHGATDLGLTPLVTSEPLWGLVRGALLVGGRGGNEGRVTAGPPDADR